MIPSVSNILSENLEVEIQPSKNYKMHMQDKIISGTCDGVEALKQVIYKILNTERYKYPIYSWNYGVELSDLVGEPISYVCAEAERRITEALTQDDRIDDVSDFEFDTSNKQEVVCTFVVHTIFGEITSQKGVTY